MTATMAITTTTTMTTPHLVEITTMPVNTRAASVQVTTSFRFGSVREEVTTAFRFLVTLPPLPVSRPIIITAVRNLGQEVIDSGISDINVAIVVVDNQSSIPGDTIPFRSFLLTNL